MRVYGMSKSIFAPALALALVSFSASAQEPMAGYYIDAEDSDDLYGTVIFCDGPDEVRLASFGDTILPFDSVQQDGKTVLRLGQPPLSVFLSEDRTTLTPVGSYDKIALKRPLVWDRPC